MADANFDPETHVKLAEVKLGLEVEDFVRSPVGRYLLGRAAIEVKAATEVLKKADPEDAKAVRAAQNRIALMESFEKWLEDAIGNGNNAEAQLKETEDLGGGI